MKSICMNPQGYNTAPWAAGLELVAEMKRRFPWLGTDDEANGGDVVDALADWYAELRAAELRGLAERITRSQKPAAVPAKAPGVRMQHRRYDVRCPKCAADQKHSAEDHYAALLPTKPLDA